MPSGLTRILAGFIAGALATLIFHQGMYLILKQIGLPLQGTAWNMAPVASAYGLPNLVNLMFWSGLWGILFALMFERLPGGSSTLKGFIFGCVFPLLLGSWIVVSLIKGRPVFNGLLSDWKFLKLRTGFLLNGVAFGVGLGLIYPPLARLFGERGEATR